MKKTKFLSVVLVVAVMLMGAGYAYWQQDLSISGTVDTGNLQVEFVPLLLDELISDHGDYDNKFPFSQNYMDVDLQFASDKLTCNFTDMYPGAGGYLRFRVANTGTVPAKVVDITSQLRGTTEVAQLDKFDYKIHSLRIYTPKEGQRIVGIDWSTWWNPKLIWDRYTYTDVDLEGWPIEADTFEEFKAELLDRLDDYTLEPFAFFEINGEGSGYDIVMPTGINDQDGMENLQGTTALGFDLNITFQQGE